MPVDLDALLAPAHTALVTVELQHGAVGEGSPLPALVDVVRERGVLANVGRLAKAARVAGARVVHCTAAFRPDGAGVGANCRLLALTQRRGGGGGGLVAAGSKGAEVMPELGPEDGDLVLGRLHGVDPFTGTELDAILRNLGVRTVVATGVSVNVALLGLVVGAVGTGYQVVLPTDGVAGVPVDYADAVLANTLSMLATLTTCDEVAAAWERQEGGS